MGGVRWADGERGYRSAVENSKAMWADCLFFLRRALQRWRKSGIFPSGDLVHLPPHPVWFWLVLAGPYLAWLGLWVIVNIFEVSVKPLAPWLWAGYFVFLVPYLFCGFAISGRHRTFCRISGVVAWGCYSIAFWIKRRYTFETLRGQGAKWYLPWSGAEFSIAARTRILGTGR